LTAIFLLMTIARAGGVVTAPARDAPCPAGERTRPRNIPLVRKCFVVQSIYMENKLAADNLQTIRTLMERSALYRGALAPIMTFIGTLGVLTAGAGLKFHVDALRAFGALWLSSAAVVVAGAFLIARRQALREREPFWSPPTRRVSQALLPPLTAGFLLSIVVLILDPPAGRALFIFPNVLFYGCAVHAAGFFMPRGMKVFAWLIIALGAGTLLIVSVMLYEPHPALDHGVMGFFFGVLHLAYGVYLYLTEKRVKGA
jgi:hypothetical protein